MAGHSKWANIKHRKERADAQKGKIFTRAAKELINAVKLGGPDPKANVRLRLAIQKAKESNVPNDTIDRAIKKASAAGQEAYHEIQYELYGHGGVGIIVDVMTDNKNRISSDIRIATNKRGGTVAHPGAVRFNFDRKGIIYVSKNNAIEDQLFLAVSEAGAEDFINEEDHFVVIVEPQNLYTMKDRISELGCLCSEATIEMIPKSYSTCDAETMKANVLLLEWLEQIDDVDAVFHNMRID